MKILGLLSLFFCTGAIAQDRADFLGKNKVITFVESFSWQVTPHPASVRVNPSTGEVISRHKARIGGYANETIDFIYPEPKGSIVFSNDNQDPTRTLKITLRGTSTKKVTIADEDRTPERMKNSKSSLPAFRAMMRDESPGWSQSSELVVTYIQLEAKERALKLKKLLESDAAFNLRFVDQCYEDYARHRECYPNIASYHADEFSVFIHFAGENQQDVKLADYLDAN